MSITKELSNLSYTNKDFNSIYSELLDYAKKLSYKWDPTSSDESDPGVVLLKLAAIIGDKDNYNIDKNILELMPASVTQLAAARQIFDQCGYSMKYYRSATGLINITVKNDLGEDLQEETEYNYTIPQFTMFSDVDTTIVYTSTEARTIPIKTEVSIPVIEGTITDYTVNNDPLITTQNLDSNNRLYFTESNIAENGIFVTNINSNKEKYFNYEEWKRVDNIQIQPKQTRCYRFGITTDSSVCYIEFPDDIEFLIGEGLNIKYILTSGVDGNVSAGKLKEFYVDTKFSRTDLLGANETSVDATTEDVYIKNPLSITNGSDPESIDAAYKNYKRVRDTFDTLVSLKDYSDYLVTSQNASNGYVCDRTNDIQHSHKLITTVDNSTYVKTVVEAKEIQDLYTKDEENNTYIKHSSVAIPTMEAFDLCVYALQYVPNVDSEASFKSTFQIFDMNEYQKSRGTTFAEEVKSLQHDYKDLLPNRILMIKNKYPITANIIPRYPLSLTEKIQVLNNVELSLFDVLNAKQLSFGEEIPVEKIQNAILNSDERIKTLIDFNSPRYTTYAVYLDTDGNFREMQIDTKSDDAGFQPVSLSYAQFNSYDKSNLYIKNSLGNFENVTSNVFDSSSVYYSYDVALSNLWKSFRAEIFAKNVLAGITPLYDDANVYSVGVNQTNIDEYKPVVKIGTNTDIKLHVSDYYNNMLESDVLRKNENILLTAPNFIEENNFSSYIKIIYDFSSCFTEYIAHDTKYELTNNDFIIFFWKESDVSEEYTYIKYDSSESSLAKFISPVEFNLKRTQDLTSTTELVVNHDNVITYFRSLPTGKGKTTAKAPLVPFVPDKNYSETEFVAKCLKSDTKNQVLTGTRVIQTFNINEIHINNKENGCSYVYWILNNVKDNVSVLFKSDETQYTLQSGEYFIYTNDSKSSMYLLGEGTVIKRAKCWTSSPDAYWQVDAINYDDLLSEGIDILENKWYVLKKIPKSTFNDSVYGVWAVEQQQVIVGPQNYLRLEYVGSSNIDFDVLNSSDRLLKDFIISYVDSSGTVNKLGDVNSSTASWSAKSLLNLNTSNETAQVIEEGQTIYIYQGDEDSPHEIKGDSSDSEYTPKFLQASEEINCLGGTSIDISAMFPKKDVSILVYDVDKQNVVNSDDLYNINSTVTFEISNQHLPYSKELIINFQVLKGDYLLQLIPSSKLTIDSIQCSNNVARIEKTNTYKVSVNETYGNVSLRLSVTSNAQRSTLVVPPLFKYTKDTILSLKDADFESNLLSKVATLDLNSEFNYAYKPSNPIHNPLISTEFLKTSHFYNSYTICEWDANVSDSNNENISIHDVVR